MQSTKWIVTEVFAYVNVVVGSTIFDSKMQWSGRIKYQKLNTPSKNKYLKTVLDYNT